MTPAVNVDVLRHLAQGGMLDWARPMPEVLREALPDVDLPVGVAWASIPWLGPLETWLARDQINDVAINGPTQDVFMVVNGVNVPTGTRLHPSWIAFLQFQLLHRSGQPLDSWHRGHRDHLEGVADGNLRFSLTQPPLSPAGASITLRVLPQQWLRLPVFIAQEMLPPPAARFLLEALRRGGNVLVSGPTGCGKTTFLAALLLELAETHRVVVIEDVAELPTSFRDSISMRVNGSSLLFPDCIRAALRMRPDLLAIGEIRGAEGLAFIDAGVTGHNGLATIHASNAAEAVLNLEKHACKSTEVAAGTIRGMLNGMDLVVVQLNRVGGQRRITEIAEIRAKGLHVGEPFGINPIWTCDSSGRWQQQQPPVGALLERAFTTAMFA